MATYVYPTYTTVQEVAQDKLATLTMDDPIFSILPIKEINDAYIRWQQHDDYVGLQQVRGINGAPSRVKHVGAKDYVVIPGVYGEFKVIDEMELTVRTANTPYGAPIDATSLVMQAQDELLSRRIDRIAQLGWLLLSTGTFATVNADGTILHTDSFTPQTYTASVVWSTYATATPLNDFRAVQLLARGKGVRFDSSATAYMNRVTYNNMIRNANSADMAGRRTNGLNTLTALNLNEVNTINTGEGLPNIVIWDDGYKNDSNVFVPRIADGKVVVVGKRMDNQPIGNYFMTRNANNPNGAPGAYSKIIDRTDQVPHTIEVHDGHNGGPAIFYPSAVVVMNV